MPRIPVTRVRLWSAAAVALVIAATAGTLIVASGRGAHSARTSGDGLRHTAVEVSRSHCGRGWTDPAPGTQVFDFHNPTDGAAEVYLEDPETGAVYGEVEGIGPGTTRHLTVRVGKGAYAFKCVPDDADAVTGPTVRVRSGRRGPAAVPVTQHDLIPPSIAYQKWVGSGLGTLAKQTARLRDDIDRGDLGAARADWLTAHLQYERLGAAYDAFGEADAAINGTDAGLAGGVHDKHFTGFHRVEYGLWHGESARDLRAPAAALLTSVTTLRGDWSQTRMDPAQLGLRAHEIVENTIQFELTGRTDYGSGSNLATARANLDGSREVLDRLHPILTTRYPELADLERELDRARSLVGGFRHNGRWTPLDGLSRAQRERTDAVFGDLAERLASVATLCDPRRTA
ncbi:EfeM/EfeO family lipoprotein [Streptomyces beihaiensis]|uniref:EfeM/EfeO family lipoprotein n=1 Tax=Streptomyces beihaiensis TaxID=2984495 RepID=A0ABT3TNP3_9ACTN|nr:EfeM/EfeO family lipoprotein [Streptomyces beihaiensis]MCX3058673.1 EfeM/EfeO family lipoprotein [Streptomyces beihaiensis]